MVSNEAMLVACAQIILKHCHATQLEVFDAIAELQIQRAEHNLHSEVELSEFIHALCAVYTVCITTILREQHPGAQICPS